VAAVLGNQASLVILTSPIASASGQPHHVGRIVGEDEIAAGHFQTVEYVRVPAREGKRRLDWMVETARTWEVLPFRAPARKRLRCRRFKCKRKTHYAVPRARGLR
jgi:hypothetical protein